MGNLIKNFIVCYPTQIKLYGYFDLNADEGVELVSVYKELPPSVNLVTSYRYIDEPGASARKYTLVETIPWSGTPYTVVAKTEDKYGVLTAENDSMDTGGAPAN